MKLYKSRAYKRNFSVVHRVLLLKIYLIFALLRMYFQVKKNNLRLQRELSLLTVVMHNFVFWLGRESALSSLSFFMQI